MKIKCSYCGTYIDDTLATCPNCGAPNEGVVRTTSTQPLTIEELKQWYQDRGLPPAETTRFFIGEDYKGPRAFGIYKDEKTGNCVVYKNKGNDILFKVVLNENEATLPGLNPVQGVYYRWADFKALADQIMKEHPEVK